jgi:hypothetical protein
LCKPYSDFQKINPNKELMIIAECSQNCYFANIENFHYYTIYKQWSFGSDDLEEKWVECISNQTGNSFSCGFYEIKISNIAPHLVNKNLNKCILNSTNVIGLYFYLLKKYF